ncbi:MAG TPA: DUF4013 domain-containing protein [bacterium]|nr:DUF4013 domain-containing protein [bacterium]
MFCDKCGKPLAEGAKFCPACGRRLEKPQPEPQQYAPPQQQYAPRQAYAQAAPQAAPPPPWKPGDTKLDIGRSFTFIFNDPEWWKKCLLLGLIMIIPIIGIIVVMGYVVELARQVAGGDDLRLPTVRFGDQLSLGAPYFFAFLIVMVILMVIMMVPMISGMVLLQNNEMGPLFSIFGGIGGAVVGLCFMCYMGPAFMLAIINDEPYMILSLRRCIGAMKNNPGNTVIFILMSIAFNWIGSIGAVACYVGMLFTIPIGYMMQAHLGAQLARQLLMVRGTTVVQAPVPQSQTYRADAPIVTPEPTAQEPTTTETAEDSNDEEKGI